jgi:hypothetical protein
VGCNCILHVFLLFANKTNGEERTQSIMNSYSDFLPKKKKILVGEKTLVVNEYTIAKRDAVLKIVLEEIDVMNLAQPFIDTLGGKRVVNEKEDNEKEDGATLAQMLLKVFGGAMTKLSCLTLDTAENRGTVFEKNEISEQELIVDDVHGYVYHPGMFNWVRNNLTPKQEQELIRAVVEVNNFGGLVKNYVTLVVEAMGAAGDTDTKMEAQAEPVQTQNS